MGMKEYKGKPFEFWGVLGWGILKNNNNDKAADNSRFIGQLPAKIQVLTGKILAWSDTVTAFVIYSRTPVTRTLKGNEKLFELAGFRVIGVD